MDDPFIVPLGVFVMVVLIVAIVNMMKIRDLETDVRMRLFQEELDHKRKMQELEQQLAEIRQG